MKRTFEALLILAALATGPVLAAQQGAGQAPQGGQGGQGGQGQGGAQPNLTPPTNLQVLPKDMSRPDVVTIMRGFNAALGVQCNYCHVMEGRGGRNDMAADEKPQKNTARLMLRMVNTVNQQLAAAISKPDLEKVDCGTCHRGDAIPPKFEPPPAAQQAPAAAGRPQ